MVLRKRLLRHTLKAASTPSRALPWQQPLGQIRTFASASAPSLPERVDVAIIGGGVSGLAILHHLGELGMKAVVLEKAELSSGATWHAAGLCTHFHGGNNFRFWHKETLDYMKANDVHSFHTPGSMRLIEKKGTGHPTNHWRDRLDEVMARSLGGWRWMSKLVGARSRRYGRRLWRSGAHLQAHTEIKSIFGIRLQTSEFKA